MAKLPQVSGKECVTALQRAGFKVTKQKGSHIKMRQGSVTVTVPNHNTIKPGTLRSIIRQAGLTVDGFTDLLKG